MRQGDFQQHLSYKIKANVKYEVNYSDATSASREVGFLLPLLRGKVAAGARGRGLERHLVS